MAEGFPSGIAIPSARSPATARVDKSSCGEVPRNVARYGSPLSAASLLKYAVAITLLAAPCSQTKMMLGAVVGALAGWPSANKRAATIANIVVIGIPQNLNVYCTLAEPLSKLGSKWLSSRERTQPRFNTRKTSLPGRRIQRKRL